ncbi:MAG: class I SAM-dependent methyltransferase [Candidatus Helarchaeota archaeon]|nr:class I SAM-dependent methyltransferase [Candidatus Helarchaeota archaeon]
MSTVSVYREWEEIPKPYEIGPTQKILVNLIESGLIKKGKALDLSCGTGKNAEFLIENGFDVDGVDLCYSLLENRQEQQSIKLPFKKEEFDFIYDLGGFEFVNMEDKPPLIHSVYDLLKDGGLFLLVSPLSDNLSIPNLLREKQDLASLTDYFKIKILQHVPYNTLDEQVQYFNVVLLEKKEKLEPPDPSLI